MYIETWMSKTNWKLKATSKKLKTKKTQTEQNQNIKDTNRAKPKCKRHKQSNTNLETTVLLIWIGIFIRSYSKCCAR